MSLKSFNTLKKSSEFKQVFETGKAFHTPNFIVFFSPSSTCNVGFVASKKVGKAVKRNKAKRRLRALFAIFKFGCGNFVFVAKARLVDAKFYKLEQDLKRIFTKITQGI